MVDSGEVLNSLAWVACSRHVSCWMPGGFGCLFSWLSEKGNSDVSGEPPSPGRGLQQCAFLWSRYWRWWLHALRRAPDFWWCGGQVYNILRKGYGIACPGIGRGFCGFMTLSGWWFSNCCEDQVLSGAGIYWRHISMTPVVRVPWPCSLITRKGHNSAVYPF